MSVTQALIDASLATLMISQNKLSVSKVQVSECVLYARRGSCDLRCFYHI